MGEVIGIGLKTATSMFQLLHFVFSLNYLLRHPKLIKICKEGKPKATY